MTSTSGSSGSLAQGGFDKNIASWRGHDIGALWPLSGHSGCGERLGRFLFGPSAAESLHDPWGLAQAAQAIGWSQVFLLGVESEHKYLENSWGIKHAQQPAPQLASPHHLQKEIAESLFSVAHLIPLTFRPEKSGSLFDAWRIVEANAVTILTVRSGWGNTRENSGEKLGKCSTGAHELKSCERWG